MTKVTRHGAQLVIRDLAKLTGIPFAYADRLTQAEASQVRSWAQSQPEVVKVLQSRSGNQFEALRLFRNVVDHFATSHPQEPAGGPAAWTEGRLLNDDAPIADMTPSEAEARLEWAKTTSEYWEGYADSKHPAHKTLVEQTAALLERATSQSAEQVTAPPSQDGGAVQLPAADAKALIPQLIADPAYQDPRHLSHKTAVAAVTAAYAAAYPEPGTAAPGVASPAQPNPEQRMRAIREDPAYMDGRHPEHTSKVAEMTAAYEQQYPSSAPAVSGSEG